MTALSQLLVVAPIEFRKFSTLLSYLLDMYIDFHSPKMVEPLKAIGIDKMTQQT
jgi:hypothetical protein